MPRGRPTSYRPEYAEQARQAYALGACDEDIARFFEITIRTFYRWRHQHEAFAAACTLGKEHADSRVEVSLYQRACGYDYTAERAFMFASWEKPIIAQFTKRVLADPQAALQWLRRRRPDEWRIPVEERDKDELGDIILQAFARVGKTPDYD
jgi:hypothetical protein